MATRGCGDRVAGGIYLEVQTSDRGLPVEHFLVDSPIPVDKDELGITPIGVKLIDRNGIFHVFDWVGTEFYPNVADFVEEVRVLGLSRRVPKTLDFSKITEQSKIILLHSRAWDDNYAKYPKATIGPCPKSRCPCGVCQGIAVSHAFQGTDHKTMPEMCAACWYHNIEGGEPAENGTVVRHMPSFEYVGRPMPNNIKKQKHQLAIFMRLPIHNIAVIRDLANKQNHEDAENKAGKAGIPVILKDE